MTSLLVIESSARQQDSVSRQLTAQFVDQWRRQDPQARVQVRDLGREPLPHLDETLLGGWMLPADQQTPAQQAALARSEQAVAELKAADVLVLAAPMYNFAIPSTLKSWLDHVMRAGVTFRYTEQGREGLLTGKRAIILTARGGIHAGAASDHQEAYLRFALGFIGITDVEFVHAEGLNMGPELAEQGLAAARARLGEVVGKVVSEAA